MLKETDVPKIRDGVDIYLISNEILQVYFMNTRKRMQFKANNLSVILIEAINGKDSILHIQKKIEGRIGKKVDVSTIVQILNFLYSKGILIENNPDLFEEYMSSEDMHRYERQINFWGDFLPGAEKKYEVQQRIQNTKILLFGCGAVGGWIATHLVMSGVRQFTIYDMDTVEESDISRHVFFKEKYLGRSKVDALEDYLLRINSNIIVNKIHQPLSPGSKISEIIKDADFIINTADEPYIGHTSLKISRECIKQRKPHYIAGGFDAHLASTGELIIPGLTPCVDCYAEHFREVLIGWKPQPHPVKERYLEIGGISSMSLFSGSFAVIEIIKFIGGLLDFKTYGKSRGEFIFESLDITYLNVSRDINCKTCGGIEYVEA
jgi:molybdopterin/thiamine biosynthesis adenylyltransferase